uniref:ITPR-interacting domain-containing protein n=1 Tax=Nothobranchius furzeri TaxID=105023 RepID=A0A8C6MEQ4_NOTFU
HQGGKGTSPVVSEVLELCSEDAEETLYELGFGSEEPQVTVRIPPRFLTFPSQAQGINFRLFLDAQIRRIREEDPSLSLASRTLLYFTGAARLSLMCPRFKTPNPAVFCLLLL